MTPTEFIAQCRECVSAGGGTKEVVPLVQVALSSQKNDPSWRNLDEFMFRSEDLLIVNLTLPPFAVTPVHDHGMWAVVGISQGCEVDRLFARRGGRLAVVQEIAVSEGNALELSPEAIHSIFNPLPEVARGIHVYGGDMVSASRRMWNPKTAEELAYDGQVFERWCEELTLKATRSSCGANGI